MNIMSQIIFIGHLHQTSQTTSLAAGSQFIYNKWIKMNRDISYCVISNSLMNYYFFFCFSVLDLYSLFICKHKWLICCTQYRSSKKCVRFSVDQCIRNNLILNLMQWILRGEKYVSSIAFSSSLLRCYNPDRRCIALHYMDFFVFLLTNGIPFLWIGVCAVNPDAMNNVHQQNIIYKFT